MTVIIPTGFAQITHTFTGPLFRSGTGALVYGVGSATEPFIPIADVVGLAHADFRDNILPEMDSRLVLERTVAIDATSSSEVTTSAVGGSSFAPVPPNVALLVRKNTVGRGRRRQGRMFLPALLDDEDVGGDGAIDPTRLAAIQTALTSFLTAVQTDMYAMVILQNSEGETPPVDPPPEVTALLAQPVAASQRRRLRP